MASVPELLALAVAANAQQERTAISHALPMLGAAMNTPAARVAEALALQERMLRRGLAAWGGGWRG